MTTYYSRQHYGVGTTQLDIKNGQFQEFYWSRNFHSESQIYSGKCTVKNDVLYLYYYSMKEDSTTVPPQLTTDTTTFFRTQLYLIKGKRLFPMVEGGLPYHKKDSIDPLKYEIVIDSIKYYMDTIFTFEKGKVRGMSRKTRMIRNSECVSK